MGLQVSGGMSAAERARLLSVESSRVYLNRPDLGLALDGVTDDTVAAQAVIDSHDEAVFVLPPGSTMLTGTLTPKSNQHWIGYGATVQMKSGITLPIFYRGITDYSTELRNMSWRGISFVGNGRAANPTEAAAREAFYLRYIDNIVVEDCRFEDFASGAVLAVDSTNVWILNNHVKDCGVNNAYNIIDCFTDPSMPDPHFGPHVIHGNHIEDCGSAGIAVSAIGTPSPLSTRTQITDNTVEGTSWYGIVAEFNTYGTDVVISGNHCLGCSTAGAGGGGILAADTGSPRGTDPYDFDRITISDNVIDSLTETASRGIVNEFSDATITGNTIRTSGIGIDATASTPRVATNQTIVGNTVTMLAASAAYSGIQMASSTRVLIADNIVDCQSTGRGHGMWLTSSTEVQVANNLVVGAGRAGIKLDGCDDATLTGNVILDANAGSNSAEDGAGITVLNSADRLTITGGKVIDRRGTPRMTYGVYQGSVDTVQVNVPLISGWVTAKTTGPMWRPDGTVAKTADEAVNNSVTLQNDDHLLWRVEANEVWHFDLLLYLTGVSTTADFKAQMVPPSGATVRWMDVGGTHVGAVGTGSSPFGFWTESTVITQGLSNGDSVLMFTGWVFVSSTAGNVQLQWAQNTQTAEDVKVRKGSHLSLRRIA